MIHLFIIFRFENQKHLLYLLVRLGKGHVAVMFLMFPSLLFLTKLYPKDTKGNIEQTGTKVNSYETIPGSLS